MFLAAVVVLGLFFFIRWTFIVVPHQSAFIRHRLGSYKDTLQSGFHFLIPFIHTIAYRHTLKEEVIDVPSQVCITKDNVQVEVDGIIYIKVLDPKLASYGINDYRFASIQLAQTNMRSEVGKLDLDKTFMERERINDSIILALDKASAPWGIKVTRYEIKNILPPRTVLATMEKQMTAERDKRAEILHSEGERSALINMSEGEKQEAINISEGEKQRRINEAEGTAKQIELVAEATADAIRAVATSINNPGGQEAVQLRITEEFIKQFGGVIEKAKTTVVPLNVAMLQGAVQGLTEITKVTKPEVQKEKA